MRSQRTVKSQRIALEVSGDEFGKIEELRGNRMWRELFLTALGIETKRRKSGPRRHLEPKQGGSD